MRRFPFSSLLAFFSLLALFPIVAVCAACPARADYIGDQMDACYQTLTPTSRATIIEACGKLLQLGELPVLNIQSPAFVARGNAYAAGADFAKAVEDFSTAISIDPNNPVPLSARGMVLMKQRKNAEAFDDFDAAVKLDGNNAMALYGRGLSEMRLGKDGAADRTKAASQDPIVAGFYADNGLVP